MYEIMKGVEKPVKEKYGGYPFDKMEVGDMFYIELNEIAKASAYASLYGKHNNKKFSSTRLGAMPSIWRDK